MLSYGNEYVKGLPYLVRIMDISTGGARICHLLGPKHTQKRIGIQFMLPKQTVPIYADCSVERSWEEEDGQLHGVAVRFRSLIPQHRRLIQSYIDSLPVEGVKGQELQA